MTTTPWTAISFDPPPGTCCETCHDSGLTFEEVAPGQWDTVRCWCDAGEAVAAAKGLAWVRRLAA